MLWVSIVIVAHLLNAFVFLIDKHLLHRPVPNPVVYSFFVGMLSLGVLVLIPFGFSLIPLSLLLLSLLAGATYTYGLIALYYAFKRIDISDAAPLAGSFTPIFTFLFSTFLIPVELTGLRIFAFTVLVLAGFAISLNRKGFRKILNVTLIAAALFGLSLVLTKKVFLDLTFINGLIWTRIGMTAGAITLLLYPGIWGQIKKSFSKTKQSTKTLFVGNKLAAGFAFLMILYAINLGSVNIVNALQGIQYVFLMILATVFAGKYTFLKKEHVFQLSLNRKILAVSLVFLGLLFLGLSL